MSQNKNNNAVWNTRIKKKTSNIFKKVGSSIEVDKRLYKEDILASVSHAEMLYKQKIITIKIKDKILWGLKRIQNEIEERANRLTTGGNSWEDILTELPHNINNNDAGNVGNVGNDNLRTDINGDIDRIMVDPWEQVVGGVV